MSLSNDLLSQFAKVTKDDKKKSSESSVYGTIKSYNGKLYVQMDGSEILTPTLTTANMKAGERVIVQIKDHSATIIGNISSPSASSEDVDNIVADLNTVYEIKAENVLINQKLDATEAEIKDIKANSLTAGEADIKYADIESLKTITADIEELETNKLDVESAKATYATITNLNSTNAEIDDLKTNKLDTETADIRYASIESINSAYAEIDKIKTDKLDAATANVTYAKITDLDAAAADIEILETTKLDASVADVKYATIDSLNSANAEITKLQTNKLDAESADIRYANINFSNINMAAVEALFSKSGIIENLVVGDTNITGTLVGVTIKGDLIEGNTIIADKLVVQGEDGLYYKLNTDGIKVEAEQTEYNSLNGSIITTKSITASKISVDDLVAFGATIGGFKITENSIYSGAKASATNTTEGMFFGKDGQMAVGDATNFVKYYKDQNGKFHLEISADSMILSSSNKNIEDMLNEMSETIDNIGNSEDIQNLTERITNAETTIAKNSQDITLKASKTEVENTYATISSLNTTNANVTAAQNTANSAVTKADNAQSSVDNLEIGGRNLVIGTSEEWIDIDVKSWSGHLYHKVNGLNSFTHSYEDYGVKPGDYLTFSADIKATGKRIGIRVDYVYGDSSTARIGNHIEPGETGRSILTIPILEEYDTLNVYLGSDGTVEETITQQYKCLKIEKGNRATDWSPAPEDIETDINELQNGVTTLETRVTNAETTIAQNSDALLLKAEKTEVETAKSEAISTAASDATTKANNALSSANTNTTNLLKEYTKTSDMEAAINLKADSITNSVSATYATKATVENVQNIANTAKSDIDNLKIGGRNLALGTSEEWQEVTVSSWSGQLHHIVNGTTNYKHTYEDYGVSIGDQLTFSVDIKANGKKCFIRVDQYKEDGSSYGHEGNGIQDGETGRSVLTVDVLEDYIGFNVYIGSDGTVSEAIIQQYKCLKIEKGNRASEWTPAPEDLATVDSVTEVDERLISAESSLTILSNNISANVTEINNLESRMSSAELTATDFTVRLDGIETDIGNLESNGSIVTGTIIGYTGDTIPEGYEQVEIDNVTNYMNFSSSGLVIGNMKETTLGNNVLIGNNNVDIRSGETTLASFRANNIYLGKNSETSVIDLCNGSATMRVKDDVDFRIYTDKRLVMSAYNSMLLDCWRDSTHMTRIAIQSSDPDDTSLVGGIQFTIYQDNIQNTVQMLGNDIIHKVTDGTNETYTTMHESIYKVNTSGTIVLNSPSSVQIGDSSSYSFGLRLGSTYTKNKSINCYWIDGEIHDLMNQSSNGQTCYFGAADIGETTNTNVRGKYVRLYAHSGGGVYLGSSGSTAVTSDRNMKKDILDIDEKYIKFFDLLRPVIYKYINGHRDHGGMIAQEVEEALEQVGLTTEQFAGLVIENDVTLNPNYDSSLSDEENAANETHYDKLYSLRYEEFIPLLIKKVQNLQKQLDELKGE